MRTAIWVLCFFATIFGYSAVVALDFARVWVAVPLAISIIIGIVGSSSTFPNYPQGGGKRIARIIGLWSVIEIALIIAAANLLPMGGLSYAITPAISIIVGLHFIPLARSIPAPIYYVTAAAMVMAGLAALAFPAPYAMLVAAIASAIILWLTAIRLLRMPQTV